MPTYNKLVRDGIPRTIAANGKSFRTRILQPEEYAVALRTKLQEETEEFLRAKDPEEALEELADLLEVIRALAGANGADWDRLEAIRAMKAEKRGGFEDRIYLVDVDDGES
ncbi:nucleoside triphosphate pyrophosphohydrolase [Paenibacillus sacheonensis]|uniref:Phosphoribosyl-ATP pyrophosphohydrolase n=1 Tax=Paenibacillus sacheonensis TaxID=742054 RepID=A0A7X5C183_9BACL|nr:nucleoside triphosphate pyrophosphohydrolase [Paenibacillus sacheonensis]MBM7568607.1 putative house-cleaning noncanonical NTP pyrophosphatase (MazG superfamily) [Paenibacillus sacheonensis]NBC72497.1 phosphoribosyl-ATP pyrophosphohydrolase [Paenibacillus sacheonensis]